MNVARGNLAGSNGNLVNIFIAGVWSGLPAPSPPNSSTEPPTGFLLPLLWLEALFQHECVFSNVNLRDVFGEVERPSRVSRPFALHRLWDSAEATRVGGC